MRSLVLDSVLAGSLVMDQFNDDPAILGIRVLELKGQSIDATDPEYEKLIERTYVGDDNNDTAEGFYRADSSDGTNRSTTGDYFILPDARGTFLRATGANSILEQPGGAAFEGPEIGFSQNDQMQRIEGEIYNVAHTSAGTPDRVGVFSDSSYQSSGGLSQSGEEFSWIPTFNFDSANSPNSRAGSTDDETRPVNIGCHVGVRY